VIDKVHSHDRTTQPPTDTLPREAERSVTAWAKFSAVWNVQRPVEPLMINYRRIALWLMVLLVPGGVLLLPLLIADMRQRRVPKQNQEAPSEQPIPGVAA
jgi:hypothetical protein